MHRYVIHRQFHLTPGAEQAMKIMYWILFGAVSTEFVVQHRKHHEFSDSKNDPHSPRFGFWKLLINCLIPSFFLPYRIQVSAEDYRRYGVLPSNTFVDKYPRIGVLLLLLTNILLFGWYGILIWVIQLFVVNLLTITTITVFGHSFGYRNFNLNDYTKNIVPTGILCVGEELHNNHHKDSRQCNFAINRNEFDLGFYYLQVLNKFNLVQFKEESIPMFYEKLDFIKYDHDKLVADVKKYVFPLGQKVIQGEEYETPAYHGFGGWSLTSRTGDWQDGWDFFQNDEGEAMETYFPKNDNNYKSLKFFNIAMSTEHNNPTQGYQGEIARVLDQIAEMGLTPRRARVTCLKAGAKSLVHKDADDNEYMARIHIPLITNLECTFTADGETLYMEPGNVYMVWVNIWHQIRNDSDQDRYHLIMDAYDTKHITEHFKYQADIQELFDHHKAVRKNIDDAVVTPEEFARFEAVRQTFVTRPKHQNR
jgi:fatty-acid desaturase